VMPPEQTFDNPSFWRLKPYQRVRTWMQTFAAQINQIASK